MNIIAYTYEAGIHCIDCTTKWAIKQSLKHGGNGSVRISENNLVEFQVTYFNGTVTDSQCAPNAVFSGDGTCLVLSAVSDLACGDCHEVIEEYTHGWNEEEGMVTIKHLRNS